jgi:hypothetical protein
MRHEIDYNCSPTHTGSSLSDLSLTRFIDLGVELMREYRHSSGDIHYEVALVNFGMNVIVNVNCT